MVLKVRRPIRLKGRVYFVRNGYMLAYWVVLVSKGIMKFTFRLLRPIDP